MSTSKLLSGYRVLDLCDEPGTELCGKLLADLGADVVIIEKPGGSRSRQIGPYFNDTKDPDRSLFWFAFNANKRGITLNLETSRGVEIFQQLATSADIIVESFQPGYLDALGLGYERLAKTDPQKIMVSITPYGQTGPKAHWKGTALTAWASSSYLSLCGYRDRAPLFISFPPLPPLNAAVEAAGGSLVALWERENSGKGQHVDISIEECGIMFTGPGWMAADINKENSSRHPYGIYISLAKAYARSSFPCKDGYVATLILGGGGSRFVMSSKAIVDWMDSEGAAPEWLKDLDWVNDYAAETLNQDKIDRVEGAIIAFLKTKTKQELYRKAQEGRITLAPASTASELATSEQLQARGFWIELPHPELGESLKYAGPWAKLSDEEIRIERRAPLIGEHNREIYLEELGMSDDELTSLSQAGVV
ncbi:MAG: CoA transferase [Chloroflexi bacterium]|nr:CoA transferase [Chloroflexota bacterium]